MSSTVNQETSTFSHDRVSVYNVGDDFLSGPLATDITERGVRYRDAVQISVPSGEYWLFDYGIVVFWGVEEDERKALLNRLMRETPVDIGKIEDHLRFKFGQEFAISKDVISLPNQNSLTRLAVSHALAQGIKLAEYELNAQNTITQYSHLPEVLAQTGKIALSRKEIAKIRGRLFSTKSDIILHYGLLDTPDFFWEYPEHELLYNQVARYMEIHQRIELLSKKLSTIHELFEMLADEQKHQHSSFLEWIVIILIAIEVVIYFVEEIKKMN